MNRQQGLYAAGALLVTFVAGLLVASSLTGGDEVATLTDPATAAVPDSSAVGDTAVEPATPEPVATPTPPAPTPTEVPAEPTPTPAPPPEPVVVVVDRPPPSYDEALGYAQTLAPSMVLPSDCGLPIDVPESLPNSPREYRSGIHQGVDFICSERGRDAVAAAAGRVVMVVGDYVSPTPADRDALLGIAGQLGATPPWTLAMLYGNFVIVDHGLVDGVGHVVSAYTHLDSVDPDIAIGQLVEAGTRLGEIGNLGTSSCSTGVLDPPSLHLHWEIYVDDLYLGAGLDVAQTREVYRALFAASG
jgi:murein DD-endopeptidase MepM/ murein hydrolase activator NlpD